MSQFETSSFQLLVHGNQANSALTKEELSKILSNRCGFQMVELQQLLQEGPFMVQRASSPSELKPLHDELKEAGAQVSIVRDASALNVKSHSQGTQTEDFRNFFEKYSSGISKVLSSIDMREVEELVSDLITAREQGRRIFLIGNGGSAANASHIATDLAKQRFPDERTLFRVMSLTDNVSLISAAANDEGYNNIFSSQLRNLVEPQDIVIAISSSGNSQNVIQAVELAGQKGALTYAIVGFDGGKLAQIAHKKVYIPSKKGQYGYMEDATLILGHMLTIFIYERDKELQQS